MNEFDDNLDESSDDVLFETIRISAEASEAFLATGEWGRSRFKKSINSRGDCFDRCGEVVFEDNGHDVLKIPVSSLPATIGSSQQADYVLNMKGISRLHCHLEPVGNLVRICDDDSTNGVILNHKKIDQEDLCDGDELQLGTVVLRVRKM